MLCCSGLAFAAQGQSPPRGYSIPLIDLASETNRQVIVDREPGQYLGHPTTVLLEDGKTIVCVYPKGHGRGAIVLKRSTDGGLTWSERLPVPESWATSKETPTIHRVVDGGGKKRLIVWSGLYPARLAVSDDDGSTWSELKPAGDWGGVVVMSSVEPLRTGPGRYMAMFHDDGRFMTGNPKQTQPVTFTLYKTISPDGGLTWLAPEPIFGRSDVHLCEPGLIRSPDGKELAVLLRENSRKKNSHVIFSRDEGKTWTAPREVPGALTGDRHTGKYAPDGRLFISFRDTTLESPTRGDWVAWVGKYEDISAGREGQYRVRLMKNHKAADCAYPGVEVLPDGALVTTTYGHWTSNESPYVVSVRLKLSELDQKTKPVASVSTSGATKPNFIFVLADDLGYADIGCFGQKKIRTPNIDRLGAEGMRFTQHYSGNAVCAPSRCVLMTGKHPGHAFIRNNQEVKPEGQYPLPEDTVTIAKLLQKQGYRTGAFGKWGLGGPGSSGEPLKQGFNRFYGYNCQRVAHNYYPTNLWDDDRRTPLNNLDFAAHQKLPADANPNDPASYARYRGKEYAPDLIAEQARRFIRDNRDRPFFLYFPTTVPHLALQVPEDSVKEYEGKFEDQPYPGGKGYLPNFTPHATYAAMITRMDREVGRMIDLVAELGLDERTVFIFSSDNGPLYDRLAGTDSDFFESAAQFRGRKGSLYEGGIRVPCVVRWKGHIKPGGTSERVTGFEDWLPTLLDLAGGADSAPRDIDGISFAPTLLGGTQELRPFLYREFPAYGGFQSVRLGNWKGVRANLQRPKAQPQMQLELYDLTRDPSETKDVSAEHPDVVARLQSIMREQHTPSEHFRFPALDNPK
jgi:arylsulfatase A-like enzyme